MQPEIYPQGIGNVVGMRPPGVEAAEHERTRDAGHDREAEKYEGVEFRESQDVNGDRSEHHGGYLERVGQGHHSSS
jgi:hypothetical protein